MELWQRPWRKSWEINSSEASSMFYAAQNPISKPERYSCTKQDTLFLTKMVWRELEKSFKSSIRRRKGTSLFASFQEGVLL